MKRNDTWDLLSQGGTRCAAFGAHFSLVSHPRLTCSTVTRGSSQGTPDAMPSQKRRRLEQQMKLRAPLEEVQQRPPCQRLDAEKDDLSVSFIEAQC